MIVMFCVARVSFVISEFWGCFFFVFASVTLDQSLFSSIDVVPLVALLDVRVSVPSNLGSVQRRTFRTCKLVRLPFPSGSGLGPS